MRITIACPTNRGINPITMQCLMDLVGQSKHELHVIIPEEGYTIAENRNYTAFQALKNKSEYLLMVDDDMTFEPDILDRLLENKKEICGVAYHPRCETGTITKYLDETHAVNIEQSDDPKYKDTFECWATGTGIILIKCDIFLKMEQPWFAFKYHKTGQCKLGEDWYFCENAKKIGIKTYADPKPKVGHQGEVIY